MTDELSFVEEDLAKKLIRPAVKYTSGQGFELNFETLIREAKRMFCDIPATDGTKARRLREWENLVNSI